MEYVMEGNFVGRTVSIDGTTYNESDYATLTQLTPVKPTPTLSEGQTFDWNSGSEINGEWVRFVVREKTADEKMSEIRAQRNTLLSNTDWTGMSDVTMSAEMTTYRQALRDLPSTVNVDSPVYPTKP
jgi:hypothetical protein